MAACCAIFEAAQAAITFNCASFPTCYGPGLPETICSPLCDHIERVALRIVVGFSFSWRDVPDGPKQAAVVEPVDPFQSRHFDGLQTAPRPAAADDLGLVETIDRFGQGVVIGVADAADGGFDARFSQTFGVTDRDVLTAAITVMHLSMRTQPHVQQLHARLQSLRDRDASRFGAFGEPRMLTLQCQPPSMPEVLRWLACGEARALRRFLQLRSLP